MLASLTLRVQRRWGTPGDADGGYGPSPEPCECRGSAEETEIDEHQAPGVLMSSFVYSLLS